jgi:hypothetical protein
MLLTKLSLAGNNLITPMDRESLIRDIPAGDGKIANFFLGPKGKSCMMQGEAMQRISTVSSDYIYETGA